MNVVPIILLGGFGKRLKPISTEQLPKQFIKFFKDGYSLFQKTILRIRKVFYEKDNDIIIVINNKHLNITIQQLQEIDEEKCIIICENESKNTFPPLLLSIKFLDLFHKFDGINTLFISPSDSYIENIDAFTDNSQKAIQLSAKYQKHVLFGVIPDSANTQYGYIEIEPNKISNTNIFNVVKFYEKPNFITATKFFNKKNFFWNSGSFVFNKNILEKDIKTFQENLFETFKDITFKKVIKEKFEVFTAIQDIYCNIPQIQLDKAIIEQNKNLLCIPAKFDWCDVGSQEILNKLRKDGKIK